MKPRLPYPSTAVPSIVTTFCLTLTLSGCGGTATPAAPSPVEQLRGDVSLLNKTAVLETRRDVLTFPLVNGTFTFTLSASDGSVGTVTGTYSGEAIVSVPGTARATLELHIRKTRGIGSTITAIEAEGTGSFVDEGDFALSLLLTSSLTTSPLRVTVRGTSVLSCSDSNRILVTLHGTDSARGFLEITADLEHEVEQTECLS